MPSRSATKARPQKAAPPPEPEDDLPDLTPYATKNITAAMQEFAEWLEERTGYEVDERSVALAGTLRMQFQKEMREQGSNRARGNSSSNGEREPEPEEEEEPEEEAPAPRRATRASKTAPPKASTARRRGKTTAAAEAPY